MLQSPQPLPFENGNDAFTSGLQTAQIYTLTEHLGRRAFEVYEEAIYRVAGYHFALQPQLAGERIFLVGNISLGHIYGAVITCEVPPGDRKKAFQLLLQSEDSGRVTSELSQSIRANIPGYRDDSGEGPGLHIEKIYCFGDDNPLAILDVLINGGKLNPYGLVQFGVPKDSRLAAYMETQGFLPTGIESLDGLQELFVKVNPHTDAHLQPHEIPEYSARHGSPATSAFRVTFEGLVSKRELDVWSVTQPVISFSYVTEVAEVCCLREEVVEKILAEEASLATLEPEEWWTRSVALSLFYDNSIERVFEAVIRSPSLLRDCSEDTILLWFFSDIVQTNFSGSTTEKVNKFLGSLDTFHAQRIPQEILDAWRGLVQKAHGHQKDAPAYLENTLAYIAELSGTAEISTSRYRQIVCYVACYIKLLTYKNNLALPTSDPYLILPREECRRPLENFLMQRLSSSKLNSKDWSTSFGKAIQNFRASLKNHAFKLFERPLCELVRNTGEASASRRGSVVLSFALNLQVPLQTKTECGESSQLFRLPVHRFGISSDKSSEMPLFPADRPELLRRWLKQASVFEGLSIFEESTISTSKSKRSEYRIILGARQHHLDIGAELYGFPQKLWFDIVRTHPQVIHNSVDQTWTLRCLLSLFEPDPDKVADSLQRSFTVRRLLCGSVRSIFKFWILSRCHPTEREVSLEEMTDWKMKSVVKDRSALIPASEMLSGLLTDYSVLQTRTDRFKPQFPDYVWRRLDETIQILQNAGNAKLPLSGFSLNILRKDELLLFAAPEIGSRFKMATPFLPEFYEGSGASSPVTPSGVASSFEYEALPPLLEHILQTSPRLGYEDLGRLLERHRFIESHLLCFIDAGSQREFLMKRSSLYTTSLMEVLAASIMLQNGYDLPTSQYSLALERTLLSGGVASDKILAKLLMDSATGIVRRSSDEDLRGLA